MKSARCLLVVLFAALTSTAHAQDRPGTKYAFLVGCSGYPKSDLRPLPYAIDDIELFRQALLATGFEDDNIVLLHDKMPQTRYKPEKAKILRELDALIDGMRPTDTLVVALAGHGIHFKGDATGYFCPLDSVLSDKTSLIPMDGAGGIFSLLKNCKAQKKALIVNAPRNDPLSEAAFRTGKYQLDDEDNAVVPEGIAALYSTQPGQRAYYDAERRVGFFFDHLARAWKGEYHPMAASWTLADVFERAIDKTRLDVNRVFENKQVPLVRGSPKGEWVVSTRAAANAPRATVTKSGIVAGSSTGPYQPFPEKTYVVLVGVGRSSGAGIKDRVSVELDAVRLHGLLGSKEHLGVPAKNMKLLLSTPAEDAIPATRANILSALEWLEKVSTRKDQVILGFFGNGAPVGNEFCLFAADSSFSGRDGDAVVTSDFETRLKAIACKRLTTFVDIDYHGYIDDKKTPVNANLSQLYREFFAPEETNGKWSYIASNNGVLPPLTEDKKSVFMKVLMEGIEGAADRAGEPDGFITIDELRAYAGEELTKNAVRLGTSEFHKQQGVRWAKNHFSDFPLFKNPAVYSKTVALVDLFEKASIANNLGDELHKEGQMLLSVNPKLQSRRTLRGHYRDFAEGRITAAALRINRSVALQAAQLDPIAARKFGTDVMQAYGVAMKSWTVQPSVSGFTSAALARLYRVADETMSLEYEQRLKTDLTAADSEMLLAEARLVLGAREDLAKGQDVTVALNGALYVFDPRASYLDPESVARAKRDIKGGYAGIGVRFQYDALKQGMRVTTPIFNGPAHKADIWEGDIIREVINEVDADGRPFPSRKSTKDITTEDAVKLMIGKAGTRVRVVVDREGKILEIPIYRGPVAVESVLGYRRKQDGWLYWVDEDAKIGYLRNNATLTYSPRDLEAHLRPLLAQGLRGLVLDLRYNSGGPLNGAIDIADLFLDNQLIVNVRTRTGAEQRYTGKSPNSFTNFPMVVLVNRSTASGAEIIASSLQDHGRAVVAGERTFGHGSVSTYLDVAGGGQILISTGTLWRPNNNSLEKQLTSGRDDENWGVRPDPGLELIFSPDEYRKLRERFDWAETVFPAARPPVLFRDRFEDRQLAAAVEYLKNRR